MCDPSTTCKYTGHTTFVRMGHNLGSVASSMWADLQYLGRLQVLLLIVLSPPFSSSLRPSSAAMRHPDSWSLHRSDGSLPQMSLLLWIHQVQNSNISPVIERL